MAGIFSRIFKIGQAQAHSAVDALEDPIKLTEQGVRDLKEDLQKSLTSLAEVKSIAIRFAKDAENNKRRAADYERKALLLLQRAKDGQIDMSEAERLATDAVMKKDECTNNALAAQKQHEQQQKMVEQLQNNISQLKSKISSYENDLIILKARARTADSMKKINKQMAKIDSSGTIAMLDRMKTKVEEDESLAAAYGEIASVDKTVDDEISTALASSEKAEAVDKLADLKAKLGITEK
jgi:phage shock protein A